MAHENGVTANREIAPIPRLFGRQAARVAALMRVAPSLALRLSLAPARDLHVVSAYLDTEAARGAPLEGMAAAILSRDPRELLAHVLDPHPGLFGTLARAALPAWSAAEVGMLNTALHSETADLLRDGEITLEKVQSAHGLLAAHPVVRRLRHGIGDQWRRDRLALVVDWLEHRGALHDLAGIPSGAGRTSVARRLERDVGRLRAPSLPFTTPPGWMHLDTPAALWAAGRELRNCMAPGQFGSGGAVMGLLDGEAVFLLHSEEKALARLQRVQGWAWRLVEVRTTGNAAPSRRSLAELRNALRDSGVVLIEIDLGDALSSLLDRGRDGGLPEAEDDDAVVEEERDVA